MSDQEKLVQPDEKSDGPLVNVGTNQASGGAQYVGASGPRQPTMPVVNQPREVPLQQVPYQMPLYQELAVFNFGQASWSVLQNAEARHGGDSPAVNLIHGGLRKVIATAGNARPESLESYDQKYRKLIAGVQLSGETLIGSQFFDFSKVEFQHILDSKQGVTPQPKPAMLPGRIYLTNKRLLLLSAGNTAGLQLTENSKPGQQPQIGAPASCKIFSVTGSKTWACRYESIPLADVLGVDMSSVFSGTSSTTIKGTMPQSSIWTCCFPEKERWEESPLLSATHMIGVINLGALLPPWQTKCNVLIFLPQNSETSLGVEFIRTLQHTAPAFQSS